MFASIFALTMIVGPKGEAIVRQIDALAIPPPDLAEMRVPAKATAYREMVREKRKTRNALILQLYRVDPSHPKTVPLMRERWAHFERVERDDSTAYVAKVLADIDRVLANRPTRMVRTVGEAARILVRLDHMPKGTWAGAGEAVKDFIRRYPAHSEGVNVVLDWMYKSEGEEKREASRTFLAQYPRHEFASQVRGTLRLSEGVGKPFALRFDDAVSGKPFDIESLKGKVVAVDFWATWCGPCVSKMPEMQRIRDAYSPQGFEIVGVSLDAPEAEGGLAELKAFLVKTGYNWPQFYQGKAWSSPFSASWGVMAIPQVFLIDRKGVLRETDVADLEASVKRLLAEPLSE